MRDDAARVSIEFLSEPDVDPRSFEISYYDTPFTDNLMLRDRHRLAVVLEDVIWREHPHQATFRIIEFPANYIVTGYKPSLEHLNAIIKEGHD